MFHFPAFPPHQLYIHQRVTAHNHGRVSPFGHPRINAQLATPRGISQPLTSFIGSLCQGIHRAPFTDNTKTNKDDSTKLHKIKKILASTIQFSNNTTPTTTRTQQAHAQSTRCPTKRSMLPQTPNTATNQALRRHHIKPCDKQTMTQQMISTRIQQKQTTQPPPHTTCSGQEGLPPKSSLERR